MAEAPDGSWACCGCGEVPGQAAVVEGQSDHKEEDWKGMERLAEIVCLIWPASAFHLFWLPPPTYLFRAPTPLHP